MVLRVSVFMSMAFLVGAFPANGQRFDKPVTEIEVSEDGTYRAGFMYWYATQTPVLASVEFVILGKVVRVATSPTDSTEAGCRTRLEVVEILVCPVPLVGTASRIHYLETGTCAGLDAGDSVLVFMTQYENDFAIPNWQGTNTPIGYKLDSGATIPYCDNRDLIALIRSGHAWDVDSLSSEELRLWSCIDSEGILESLIRAKENEDCN